MGNSISNQIQALIDTTTSSIQVPESIFNTLIQYEEKFLQDEFKVITELTDYTKSVQS